MLRDSVGFACLFFSMPGYYPIFGPSSILRSFGAFSDLSFSTDCHFESVSGEYVYVAINRKSRSFENKYEGAYSVLYEA